MKPERILRDDVDYILAPVWHDAKEVPEDGIYPATWGGGIWSDAKYEFGEWFYWDADSSRWYRYPKERGPIYYYPLPRPPEEK